MSRPEEKFVAALTEFQKSGGTPERVFQLIAEAMGQEFVSAAGRMLRTYQTVQGLNSPPPVHTAAKSYRPKFDPEKQRVMVREVKQTIARNFLTMVMPNGKELRDCTGRDCSRMGGWFTRIAEHVKPSQKVGNALTEEQVQKLMGPKAA